VGHSGTAGTAVRETDWARFSKKKQRWKKRQSADVRAPTAVTIHAT